MTRLKVIIFITAALILYVFNSCSNRFEAVSLGSSSSASQCKPKDTLETQSIAVEELRSPFAQGKLMLDEGGRARTNAAGKPQAASTAKYLALLDNHCLRGADDGALAKRFAAGARADNELDIQPYVLSESGEDLAAIEADIEGDPCIIGVSPVRAYRPSAIANYLNDPNIQIQSHLTAVNFEPALAQVLNPSYGFRLNAINNPVIVAVLDTGVNYDHEDLTNVIHRLPEGVGVDASTLGRVDQLPLFDGRDISPEGHGTHVAGLIAAQANNGRGGTGTAPFGVRILPVNVFFPSNGEIVSDSPTIIKGIQFAVQRGAKTINMSLGGSGDDPAVRFAIQQAINNGVFVVVSAGNTVGNEVAYEIGPNAPVFPAMYGGLLSGMVTVGSTDTNNGAKSFFSLYSPTLVEMSAPGARGGTTGLYSTTLGNNYEFMAGTSMAAPVVTGAAALIQSFYRYHYGTDLTPAVVESLLTGSATKNPALAAYFKDGNQLNMARLIENLQSLYPRTAGADSTAVCP